VDIPIRWVAFFAAPSPMIATGRCGESGEASSPLFAVLQVPPPFIPLTCGKDTFPAARGGGLKWGSVTTGDGTLRGNITLNVLSFSSPNEVVSPSNHEVRAKNLPETFLADSSSLAQLGPQNDTH
jgi:hypothetical protein